jgi:hypothetical protein
MHVHSIVPRSDQGASLIGRAVVRAALPSEDA